MQLKIQFGQYVLAKNPKTFMDIYEILSGAIENLSCANFGKYLYIFAIPDNDKW